MTMGREGTCEIAEQKLRYVRVRSRMKLCLGMFDDVDTRSRISGGQCGHRDGKHVRKPSAGLREQHVGVTVCCAYVQLEVSAYPHNVDRYSKDVSIPLADRFPQHVVPRERQRCHISIRPKVYG